MRRASNSGTGHELPPPRAACSGGFRSAEFRSQSPNWPNRHFRHGLLAACALLCTGCMAGPKYKRPPAPVPQGYKEQPPPEFKQWMTPATPMEGVVRGKWWEIYNDPVLNALEETVAISNQNVLAAEAQYRQATAAIKVARAARFPTLTTGPSVSYSRGSQTLGLGQVGTSGTVTGGGLGRIVQSYSLPFDVSWEADLWGAIRRSVTAAAETAQASAALLENARLSFQALLAQNYFSLHGLDARKKLLEDTVALYQQFMDLTLSRFKAGVASEADVALAQTQLDAARAQLIDVGVLRTAHEHAIAVLTGRPPAELAIAEAAWTAPPPPVPVGVPSALLQRRPDIAAAERAVAAANEQIGIATAAYYPTVTLTGVVGLQSSMIQKLFTWPSRFWAAGAQSSAVLWDFGRRRGNLQETEAAYDFQAATYRQTVLAAFQQVEDNLSALRILEQEAAAQDQAVRAAQRSLDISTAQYKSGITDYLQVITAQTALLSNQTTAVTILTGRMLASVLLVQALGGGWDVSQIPQHP